ncbi:hypothetical protein ACGFNU_37945 [Spirillospora sp. NPDC048911]|uniref:hypothetical protein n=1 Tax=Spirillospora sp. NPDC048911 TaxID=3364527 RepID=UPI003722C95D
MQFRKLVSAAAAVGSMLALTTALGATPANAATCYWLYANGMDGDRGRLYYCYAKNSSGSYTAWAESILITDTTSDNATAIIQARGDGFGQKTIAEDNYGGDGHGGYFRETNTANVSFHVCGNLGGIIVNCFRMTKNG